MKIEEWLGEQNTLGIDIWKRKYQYEGETFDAWLDRVSGGDEDVKRLIKEKKFLPGGRILANRGLYKKGIKSQYSNCFVLPPPEDNIESIFDTAKEMARTYSYGGGVGTDLSKLAPRGAKVHNAAKTTTGAVSFMDLYSLVTGLIAQNGRRGALMLSLSCEHPDLEEFIGIKTDLNKVTSANISVRITDEFMEAVRENKKWKMSFTREATGETTIKIVPARELFHKLAECNWDYAEPGMLFWDRCCNYRLNTSERSMPSGVNPCGEETLISYGACMLGSINLSEFVDKNKRFNFQDFFETVQIVVRGMNDILTEGMELQPLKQQRQTARDWHQTGIGIMGLADMLIKMEIPYGSPEAVDLCNRLGSAMAQYAIYASAMVAKDQGAYPEFNLDEVLESSFYKAHQSPEIEAAIRQFGLANSQILTIAPTGTLSTMLGISGGIEPIFANYYTRKTESLHGKDVYYKVYTPIVEKYMKEHNITDDKDLPGWFITAQEIPYRSRIDMQAAWQKHIDASISSTVNLPHEATVEDVEDLYMYAWEQGLKGITVYRDGCARAGILTTSDTKKEEQKEKAPTPANEPETELIGYKRKLMTGCGALHLCAFFNRDGELRETYLSKGSLGGCQNYMIGLSRMISLAARNGVSVPDIVDQLKSCGSCPSYAVRHATKGDTSKGSCCPVAVGNALLDLYNEIKGNKQVHAEKIVDPETPVHETTKEKCPECGAELRFEGGCMSCPDCGWSRCG